MESMQASKRVKQEELDRLSSLPDHLLHSVMFMLCTEDAARMSVLSKRLDEAWRKFPVIEIDEANYKTREDFLDSLHLYFQRHDMAFLQKFSLRTNKPMLDEEMYPLVDYFVNAAVNGNLQELFLRFYTNYNSTPGIMYVIPDEVLSDASSLTFLSLSGCIFGSYEVLNLPVLTNLELRHIYIESEFIQRLLESCPLLEKFSLEYYQDEMRSIKIAHERIRKFALWVSEELEELEIRLPNLKSFKYKGYYSYGEEGYMETSKFDTMTTIGVNGLKTFHLKYALLEAQTFQNLDLRNVKKLMLHYVDVESDALWFLNHQLPLLECLSLRGCKGLEEVKIMSLTIRGLFLEECVDLIDCKIMAPNLLFFKYEGPIIKIAQLCLCRRLQVNLHFKQNSDHHAHDLVQHVRLRNFLKAFHRNEMTIEADENCGECMAMVRTVSYLL